MSEGGRLEIKEKIVLNERELLEVVNHADLTPDLKKSAFDFSSTVFPLISRIREEIQTCPRCSSATSTCSHDSQASTSSNNSKLESSCDSDATGGCDSDVVEDKKPSRKPRKTVHFADKPNTKLKQAERKVKTTSKPKVEPQPPKKVSPSRVKVYRADKKEEDIDPERIGNLLLSAAKDGLMRDYLHKNKQKTSHEVTHPLAKAALAKAQQCH